MSQTRDGAWWVPDTDANATDVEAAEVPGADHDVTVRPGPATPVLGLPAVRSHPSRPRARRRSPGLLAAAASGIAVLAAVALVTTFVLRDGSADCARPDALARIAAQPVAVVRPAAVVLPAAAPPISTSSWSSGIITFYGPASTGGACMTSRVPADKYTVALGPDQFAAGAACGTYVDIKAARGTIRAVVTNLCPECPPGHFDLSNEAFAALDDPGRGRAPMKYRAVRNPAVGPLTVQVKDGSNPYWLAVRIDNHGNPLQSVEIAGSGRSFEKAALQPWGYWVDANGAGAGPFKVRVTDVYGHRATVSGIRLTPGAVQNTGVRLYGPGAGSQPAPSTSAKPSASRTATKPAASGTVTATASRTAGASPFATTTPAVSPAASGTPAGTPTAGAPVVAAPADRC